MTRRDFDEVAPLALTTDDDVLARVRELVEGAYRQQLWLMFLDDEEHQLPIVIPHDVASRPTPAVRRQFPAFLSALVREVGAAAVVVVLERRGRDDLRPGDRAWLATLAESCEAAGVRMRGPVLCSSDGFRWVSGEDFAPER